MDNLREHLEDISEIRNMMERHSKFLSLSGLSGISAGLCGLAGSVAVWIYLGYSFSEPWAHDVPRNFEEFFLLVAGLVLFGAVGLALLFSMRMAKRKNLPLWNKTARRTLVDLAIPLAAGGLFCLIQLLHGAYLWIGSATLLFYGLALLNASRNTITEIRYLAYSEIVLGLLCAIWAGQSLIFWGIGFGLMHIVYGAIMYFKYER